MVIQAGQNRYHVKVHLVGSFGDIPSVSEINHLSGHSSYHPCRLCTIQGTYISSTICLHWHSNLKEACRDRTLIDFITLDTANGIKQKSPFVDLKSFLSPMFFGIDTFHLFDQNIA